MEEIICYTEKIPSGQWQYLSFWDILLDDTWAAGSFSCPDNIYPMTGSLNRQLHAKQNYEFLLRAALSPAGSPFDQNRNFVSVRNWDGVIPVI